MRLGNNSRRRFCVTEPSDAKAVPSAAMIELKEYVALVAKVDGAASGVAARRAADISCHAGCEACCHTELTVSVVEAETVRQGLLALSEIERDVVRSRAKQTPSAEPRCVMLGDGGTCAIYDSRPLVCRTQGHALRYPDGVIPASALFSRTEDGGGVTWCPLNYTEKLPESHDVLDAERINQILAVVNRRATNSPEKRTSLRELAAE